MLLKLPRRALIALSAAAGLSIVFGSAVSAGQRPVLRGAQETPSSLSAAEIARLAYNANQRSIVLFKNQHQEYPARPATASARGRAIDSDQAPVVHELKQLHASGLKAFHIVNALSATISAAEARRLAGNPAVQAVVPDRQVFLNPQPAGDTSSAGSAATPAGAGAQPICPSAGSYILEPEALQVMNVENQPGVHTPAAHDLADGTGVKVGIIADGLDPNDPDLIRTGGQHVVFDFQNFGGDGNSGPTDGREAFLDSGAIASQAHQTYDLSKFVNPAHPLPANCNIKIKGVAPGASLAVMNVFPFGGGAFDSTILQAIEYVVQHDGVDVINESFGGNPFPDEANDPVVIANNNAVAAGVTIAVSTGDSGVTNTIGSPASNPGVIAVGGSTTFRVYRQATRYGVQLSKGGWEDNNITALSSGGTTQFGPRSVDVVAPGDRGWELCSTDTTHFFGCADFDNNNVGQPIWAAGGTSLSCPLTSGTAALVIQAYTKTHGGVKPSPALVKQILVSSAQDLGAPADHQGAGLVDSLKAVQLAASISDAHGSPFPTGNTLLENQTSLVSTGQTGTTRTFHVNVTNTSATAQTVTPTVVTLGTTPVSDDKGTVTLGTTPVFVDDRGRNAAYQTHTFTVPTGVDYLNGDIVWQAQAQSSSIVFETVFDPAGNVAAFSLLGETSGHGHVEVRHPQAGTWTSVIWTVQNGSAYSGVVRFEYATTKFKSAGTVAPTSLSLAAGKSAALTVTLTAPAQAGDFAASLRLATSGAHLDGSIPILLRSLVAIGSTGGSFSGSLTGGDTLGQQFTFQFDVPAGKPVLNLAVQLHDANYPILGYLVSPNGQPSDVQTTVVTNSAGQVLSVGKTMQFFQETPAAGRWTVVIWLAQVIEAIPGALLHEPYSGAISFQPLTASASGLPTSSSTVLPRGTPVNATISLTNNGNIRKDFFADTRLNQAALQSLGGFNSTVPLPLESPQPFFIVPARSDAVDVVGQGTVPILMDISAQGGDPDIEGTQLKHNQVIAQAAAPELAPGIWFALPEPKGPFGPNGVGNASASVSAVVDTLVLDPAVSASSGNAWATFGLNPSASYTPVSLNPGQAGSITVTITPSAPKGTVVHGFVELETFNQFTLSADEIVTFPYTYKVG